MPFFGPFLMPFFNLELPIISSIQLLWLEFSPRKLSEQMLTRKTRQYKLKITLKNEVKSRDDTITVIGTSRKSNETRQ